MTKEEIMTLDSEALEKRAEEIASETIEADVEKIEALNAELDAIEERRTAINLEIETRKKAEAEVLKGKGEIIEERKGEIKMDNKEVRNSKEYIDAFAKYIKTGKDAECRSLLTENATGGTVPVPEFVESRVRANWENDEVWRRIRKTYVRGNLKVGFEISSTGAAVHREGAAAPPEEVLTLGIVNMVPMMIKKWISVSDEVMALGSEEFLAYIYDEITYKIVQLASTAAVGDVIDAPATSSASAVGVPEVTGPVSASTIIDAMALLGDEARDLVFIANGATIAAIRQAALTAGYAYDAFQGMTVIKKELLLPDNSAWNGALIGDLSGIQANLPEGDVVRFIFDEFSLAERDLVKIVGRLYAAIRLVQPEMFVKITPGE